MATGGKKLRTAIAWFSSGDTNTASLDRSRYQSNLLNDVPAEECYTDVDYFKDVFTLEGQFKPGVAIPGGILEDTLGGASIVGVLDRYDSVKSMLTPEEKSTLLKAMKSRLIKGQNKSVGRASVTDIQIPSAFNVKRSIIDRRNVDVTDSNNSLLLRFMYSKEINENTERGAQLRGLFKMIKQNEVLRQTTSGVNSISAAQSIRQSRPQVLNKPQVRIQSLHASSRLSELGFDPIKALVDKYREAELTLEMMKVSGRRSAIAESNIMGLMQRTAEKLMNYGYLTAKESYEALLKSEEKATLDGDNADEGIQILFTNEDGTVGSNALVDQDGNPIIISDNSADDGVISESQRMSQFIPSEDISDEDRGVLYRDQSVESAISDVEVLTYVKTQRGAIDSMRSTGFTEEDDIE